MNEMILTGLYDSGIIDENEILIKIQGRLHTRY